MAYDFAKLTPDQAIALIRSGRATLDASPSIGAAKFDSVTGRQDEKQIRAFLNGDHWQGGDGWVGPKPKVSGQSDELALGLIRERFVSRNMVEDVTTRHVDGVLGREPKWSFTPKRALKNDEKPTPDELASIEEVGAALTAWWDKRKAHKLFQDATAEALLSGRAVLRLWVPAGRLKDLNAQSSAPTAPNAPPTAARPATTTGASGASGASGNGGNGVVGAIGRPTPTPGPTNPALTGTSTAPENAQGPDTAENNPNLGVIAASLEEALDHIFIEVVTAEFGTVYTDLDSQDRIGVVVYYGQGPYPGTVGPRVVEMTYLDGKSDDPLVERGTVIRSVSTGGVMSVTGTGSAGQPTDQQSVDVAAPAMALGGRLTHFSIERRPLISHQIVSLQMALNLACSMVPRNVETSGFLERILLNAQLPGTYETDVNGVRTGRFIPAAYVTGAGITSSVMGAEITQPDETKVLASPSVVFRPPSPVAPTVEAIQALEAEILKEAKQGHALGQDQVLSGISREQARADFEKSLGRSQASLNPAGRWLLETALAMAELFAKGDAASSDLSASLRAEFECFSDTGPLDAKEIINITGAVEQDILALETAQSALGVEDTNAELAKLNAQDGRRVTMRTKKAAALKAYTDAGLSLPIAAKLAGFDDDEQKIIADDALANPPVNLPGGMQPKIDPATGQPMLDANGQPVMELAPAQPANKPATPGAPGAKPPFGGGPPRPVPAVPNRAVPPVPARPTAAVPPKRPNPFSKP